LVFLVALPVGHVKGTVMYRNQPQEGVVVKLSGKEATLIDTTDLLGDYHFIIPDSLRQNDGYKVWFIKPGFITKYSTAFPQSGEALNIIMEKERN
jgi:hypothetical protein